MSSLTNPQSNYAAWERVVAELMPATSEPAGPLCRRDAKPSRHGWHPRETTAEAIAVFDAQFPWLRGAEKRLS